MQNLKKNFGWIGTILLLLIIPVKIFRFTDVTPLNTSIIGIVPSFLGPAGLLFLLLSSHGKLSHLSLFQTTLLAGSISLALEFVQLLPRTGFLAKIYYTFDWLDVASTLVSICTGYFIARLLVNNSINADSGSHK
jgi:hypothetical protein